MIEISGEILAFLAFSAFVAGFVDSIAGGGGMITIPALWLAGIPPHVALGTNKLQSCFGSFSATLHFYKKGHLGIRENIPAIFGVFIFAALGTIIVQFIESSFLSKCIPFLLIIFAIYFLFSPRISEEDKCARVSKSVLILILSLIGFYDGFFGPGTGSFLMLALIALGGFGIKKALGQAKLYNFTSNIASFLVFALGGQILWIVGIIMGIGQFIGANVGSRVALRYGGRVIKPFVVCVSMAVCIRLLFW